MLSKKLSHFSTLNCRLAFLHTFETCSLKVTSLSIVIPNNLTESNIYIPHQAINKEMSNFYLSSVNVSHNYFTVDIIIDTFASDLQLFIEHGNIHQHALKQ